MKYCAEIENKLCKMLEMGSSREDARIICDISHETFHRWLNEKSEFREKVIKAESSFKNTNVSIIYEAAKKTWTAAAWLLERKYADEYAVKNRSEVIHMNFVFSIVGQIADMLARVLPSTCPHCKRDLELKSPVISELENLSKKIDFGSEVKKAYAK